MTIDVGLISTGFLHALGAPSGPLMRHAIETWLRKEGISSVKRNNPWNLHSGPACHDPSDFCASIGPLPGQIGRANVGPGDQNVAVFHTLDDGVRANAANLVRLKDSGFGYDIVIARARAGDPVGLLNALARSSWSANRYGTKNGGPNALIPIWNSITGRHDDPMSYKTGGPGPIIEEDELDPRLYRPLATCDVGGPTTVFRDAHRVEVMIQAWAGAQGVGLYARPASLIDGAVASLAPILLDLLGGPAEDLHIGWVGIDRITNIRLG